MARIAVVLFRKVNEEMLFFVVGGGTFVTASFIDFRTGNGSSFLF